MKLKKLFAGIVAVAMMATMAAPVFAEDTPATATVTPKTVQNGGLVSIEKVITGTGYGSETVSLAVEDNGAIYTSAHTSATAEEKAGFTISIPTDTDKKGATIQQPADAGTTTASGTLYIQLPNYTRVGTYVYKFHEVKGNTVGMTYDDATKYLLVNVYNKVNSDGEIEENSALLVNAVVLNSDPKSALENTTTKGDLSGLAGNKIDKINNKYETGTYTVKKLVKGNMSDRQKEFNFKVTFENTTDKTTIPTMKVDGKAFGTEGIENLTWTSNKATYEFTLKHDQTVEFTNVPYGMKVSVVELDDNKAALTGNTNGEYTVSYVNNTETAIDKDHQTVNAVITNTSTVNPNTGVILDNAPYIALLTIVAAGAVFMVIKKRRNYED